MLTKRVGKPTGHIMISITPWCKVCKPRGLAQVSGPGDMCDRKHTGHRFCNGCGNQQQQTYTDDWQQCQEYVCVDYGRSSRFGFCSNKAQVQVHIPARMRRHDSKAMRWRWMCHIHRPEAVAKRKAKADAKYQAIVDGWDRRAKRDSDRHDIEDLLVEVAGWMAKNPELVAEDEWLQTIANKMTENETLMEVIKS